MEREFIRVRSIKDIIISSLLLIAGTVLVIIPTSDPINITGFFLLLTGLLLFFVLKSAYKDSVSGKVFTKKERFFSQDMHEKLKKALTCPKDIDFSTEDKGSTLRLDIYFNKTKVFVQLHEYVPHTYEPCSPLVEYDRVQGAAFISK